MYIHVYAIIYIYIYSLVACFESALGHRDLLGEVITGRSGAAFAPVLQKAHMHRTVILTSFVQHENVEPCLAYLGTCLVVPKWTFVGKLNWGEMISCFGF